MRGRCRVVDGSGIVGRAVLLSRVCVERDIFGGGGGGGIKNQHEKISKDLELRYMRI